MGGFSPHRSLHIIDHKDHPKIPSHSSSGISYLERHNYSLSLIDLQSSLAMLHLLVLRPILQAPYCSGSSFSGSWAPKSFGCWEIFPREAKPRTFTPLMRCWPQRGENTSQYELYAPGGYRRSPSDRPSHTKKPGTKLRSKRCKRTNSRRREPKQQIQAKKTLRTSKESGSEI